MSLIVRLRLSKVPDEPSNRRCLLEACHKKLKSHAKETDNEWKTNLLSWTILSLLRSQSPLQNTDIDFQIDECV